MRRNGFILWSRAVRGLMIFFLCAAGNLQAQDQAGEGQGRNLVIVVVQGRVEVSRAGSQVFDPARLDQPLFEGDRVRIGRKGHLTLRRADESIYRFDGQTEFQVRPPKSAARTSPTVRLLAGMLYFFHRGKPGPFDVETRTASAAVRGTEFALEVNEAGTTVVTVIDGIVDLSNEVSTVAVGSGQQGVAEFGRAPFLRAAIDAINVIQWTLYYPGVLDPDEIPFTEEERRELDSSLRAYQSGDLLRAASEYPDERVARSNAERIYAAGLLLGVGEVEEASALIAGIEAVDGTSTDGRLARALQQVVGAVKLQADEPRVAPELSSEWLAESYRRQSVGNLDAALEAARRVTAKSPEFGFGWARVAELEFSFGRTDAASEALATALRLSPRHAQAVALAGYLLAARNRIDSAIQKFDEAIAIDGGLANAWLGRGLCLIRKGKKAAGREDILTAAALEPQRALLRSYLGKAWAETGEMKLAEHELELARQFDPNDPTGWFYSALLKQQENRVNEAIRDLEHAQDLSMNRAVHRSGFMLDQDRAVRSANLARIYRDAGLVDWSVREAGRAVTADYANYSAHLFLANSYDQLRDPNRINLRYETPAEAEYLIANLLAPVGAGILSPTISQQEYSRLFESDGFGFASSTEYLSRGAWVQDSAVFGTFGNTSFSIDQFYRFDPGQRMNNDYETVALGFQLKQQLTHKDSVYFRVSGYETKSGDVIQYYDRDQASPFARFEEEQKPLLTLGYHREWSPGNHTLLLASRVDSEFGVDHPQAFGLLVDRFQDVMRAVVPFRADLHYRNKITLYTGEAQQIWQNNTHTTVAGLRFQAGDFEMSNRQRNPSLNVNHFFPDPMADQKLETDLESFSAYAYHNWRIAEPLLLVAGISYDRLDFPQNFRSPPLNDRQERRDQISPKAGFVWTPFKNSTFRGAYTRSLAGATLDQSVTLEPTQIGGLNQSFRSMKPESIGGAEAGAKFETYALSYEQKLGPNTYLTIAGEVLESRQNGVLGVFDLLFFAAPPPSVLTRSLDFRERSLTISFDHLIGDELALGARYRLLHAETDEFYPEIPPQEQVQLIGGFQAKTELSATLQQLDLHASYNHRRGFFAAAQALWNHQSSAGHTPSIGGDEFWQFNLYAGHRFYQGRAELTLGLLNLTDQDYRLNPLTLYNDLPRERTLYGRVRLRF